jgi:hypothetical protein
VFWVVVVAVIVVVFLYMDKKIVKEESKTAKKLRRRKTSTIIRQTKVLADMVVNGSSLTSAMRDNGYKEGYNPANLQKTKTWQELLARDLPDKLLSKTAKQGLKAKGGDYYKDLEIKHKYLETSLKMTGKLRDTTDSGNLTGLVIGFKMVLPKDTAEVIEGETL